MNRRSFLATTAGIATTSTVALAGCIGTASATGTLATRVSDQPGDISDFERCAVTVDEVFVKPADGERESHAVEERTFDLVELQGDRSAPLADLELDAGDYEYLQLSVVGTEATLDDGSTATVEVPGEAPLKFGEAFEIREGERTTFTADFTPVKAGGSGRYNLQPVADEVVVHYESENGTATNSTDTTTTTTNKTTATTSETQG